MCSGLMHSELWLCPQLYRSHAFFSGQRRQQVLLTQEPQGEVDQQPSNGLQFLHSLVRVGVAETLLAGVLLQISHVVDRVVGQAPEDLRRDEKTKMTTVRNEKVHRG